MAPANPKTSRLTAARLRRDLAALQGRRVAVVGDAMLDEFLWGDATRISPEAPVPVVLLEQRTWSLGGAANVAANIAALGGRPLLFAVVGADAAGQRLHQLAEDAGVELGALPALPSRPTTVKHRVFARNKHLLRFDLEEAAPIAPTATRELLAGLEATRSLAAVVVSDYAKGCITAPLIRGIARFCRTRRIPWCVDPKLTTIRHRHALVLKPNLIELEALAGMPVRGPDDLRRAAARTLRRQGCRYVLVTRGQHGMALFGADRSERWLNSTGRQVADVTGAGDTVSAVLALALAAKLPVARAAELANLAGAYVVSVPGIAVAHAQDLLDLLN